MVHRSCTSRPGTSRVIASECMWNLDVRQVVNLRRVVNPPRAEPIDNRHRNGESNMRTVILILSSLLLLPSAGAQEQKTEKLAPYYPTPEIVVQKMLELGELKSGEKMFDLGSGDGRIVIDAARKFKADATGVEFDASLVRQSSERIKTLGLAATARIIHGDLLKQDYSSADLLTVYLLPVGNEKVTPMLEK